MTLTQREGDIVRLLAAGHTDAAIAQQLGVSVRTIAYTMRDLMDRYQVRTRFQLALLLGGEGAATPGLQAPAAGGHDAGAAPGGPVDGADEADGEP